MSMSSTDYALLSQDAYQDRQKDQKITLGGVDYKVLDHANDPVTGYQGTAYSRVGTNEIIIAHRGSEFGRQPLQDGVLTDAGMVLAGVNAQTPDAMAFTKKVMQEAQREAAKSGAPPDVTVTGHSLGGTLAEITAAKCGLRGETFNAYGAAGLLQGVPQGGHQVIDHVRATDVVSAASTHFGEVRIYAVQQDIDQLSRAGYRDNSGILSPRNPVGVALADAGAAHAIDNFVPDGKTLGHSIISPENQTLYRTHQGMIDRYRSDILDARTVVSAGWEVPKAAAQAGAAIGHAAAVDIERGAHAAGQAVSAGVHVTQHAAHVVANETVSAYDASRRELAQGVHATERAAQQVGQQVAHGAQALGQDARQLGGAIERGAQHAAHDVSKGYEDLSNRLDAMLAADKAGDWTTFRQHTQALANSEAAHAMQAQAVATVDRQQQAAGPPQVAEPARVAAPAQPIAPQQGPSR